MGQGVRRPLRLRGPAVPHHARVGRAARPGPASLGRPERPCPGFERHQDRRAKTMSLTPPLRKVALSAHVASSVGWLGAVVAFLGLAIVGLTSQSTQTARGVYLVMLPAAWFVLFPFAFASLVNGLVSSLGTTWGLFRHDWVLFELLMTAFSTVVLLIYMETFRNMAAVAADPSTDLAAVRNASPVLHATLALLVLLAAAILGIYKPQGMTAYGRRKQLPGPGNVGLPVRC